MECFGSEVERALGGFVVEGFFLVRNTWEGAELVGDAEAGQLDVEFAIDGQQFVLGADDDLDFCVLKFRGILVEELERIAGGETGFVAERFLKNFGLLFGEAFGVRKNCAVTHNAAKQVGVLERKFQRAKTAHGKSMDRATGGRGDGAIMLIDVRDEFANDDRFAHDSVVRRIGEEAGLPTIGEDEDHWRNGTGLDGFIEQTSVVEVGAFVSFDAVQIVDHGKALLVFFGVLGRQIDVEADIDVHRGAAKGAVLDGCNFFFGRIVPAFFGGRRGTKQRYGNRDRCRARPL